MVRRALDGSPYYTGWLSPLTVVWVWHALFDGTRVCPCARSRELRA